MTQEDAPYTHPRQWAAIAPHRAAFIMDETSETLTYGELVTRADRAAQLFASLGVAAGETIAILVENQIRFCELIWAAKNSGLRYVAVGTSLNASDAAYIIRDCEARLLVTSDALRETAIAAAAELPAMPLLMVDGTAPGFLSYEAELAKQPAEPLAGRSRGNSMLYSSGTTGRPKGVRTEMADVPPEVPTARGPMMRGVWGFDENSVFLNPGPFYHAAPLRIMMIVQRYGGTVIGFRKFDAARILSAIERHRATHAFFVPTMFHRMLELDEAVRAGTDTSSMRHAVHGGAPCAVHIKQAMIDWWGPVIDEMYGGTEAIGHCFCTSAEWLAHPGSVGRAASNAQFKISDAEGRTLPPGEVGRVMMRNGLRVTYWGAAATKPIEYDPEGFASMGDMGYLDEDGYLYLTDRESHMIIAGGVNIYPQEAEAVLLRHPAVRDVAVVGVPHEAMGEEVKAVVQPMEPPADPDALAEELLSYCREHLSRFKCPRSVDFVNELPRSDAGKLLKRIVKQWYWP